SAAPRWGRLSYSYHRMTNCGKGWPPAAHRRKGGAPAAERIGLSELAARHREGVAAVQPLVVAGGEPFLALFARPVGEGFRVDESGLLLDVIVADDEGRIEGIVELFLRGLF